MGVRTAYEQVVDQVAGLVADVVVIVIFAGHDDLARLLGKLLEQLVLDFGQQTGGVALLWRRIATTVNHLGQSRQRLADVSRLHVSCSDSHGYFLSLLQRKVSTGLIEPRLCALFLKELDDDGMGLVEPFFLGLEPKRLRPAGIGQVHAAWHARAKELGVAVGDFERRHNLHRTPPSTRLKKQVRLPVWQAGPGESTLTSSVSLSQSAQSSLTSCMLPLVAPLFQSS